jgi:N6-L-threonylcarbamoyladenine synthase
MYTLGIETSCDETACAVLKNGDQILSSVISSSLERHKPFGGVVPEIASRHCLEAIDYVYRNALRDARVKQSEIDLIAVTQGPGLIGSVFVATPHQTR